VGLRGILIRESAMATHGRPIGSRSSDEIGIGKLGVPTAPKVDLGQPSGMRCLGLRGRMRVWSG